MNNKQEVLSWARVQIFEYPHLGKIIMNALSRTFSTEKHVTYSQDEIDICVNKIEKIIKDQKKEK